MGTGYTRQSAANIVDGLVITAGHHNAEYNALQSAFNATTGHSHDGTTGEGPQIDLPTSTTGILPINRGGTGAVTTDGFKTTLGLDNVDNTSDANKPVSGPQNTAFDIHSKTVKTTPVDADEIGLADSASSFSLKRLTWQSIRTTLTSIIQTATITAIRTSINQWSAPQRYTTVILPSAVTISILPSDGARRSLTLEHNATLIMADPANYIGQQFSIIGQQDSTGGRTLAVGSNWFPIGEATMPAVPSAPNAKFRIDAEIVGATRIDFKLSGVGV